MPAKRKPDDLRKLEGGKPRPAPEPAQPVGELGKPPPHLDPWQLKAWLELAEAGKDHLDARHRHLVEVACYQLSNARGGSPSAALLTSLSKTLGQLCLAPDPARLPVRVPQAEVPPDEAFIARKLEAVHGPKSTS